MTPIDLSLGEPQGADPALPRARCSKSISREFGRYPPIKGIPALRQAIADWMGRRYPALAGHDRSPSAMCCRSTARARDCSPRSSRRSRASLRLSGPAVLIPNPFYQAYAAAAAASGAVPDFLASMRETGFLPELDAHR